MPGGQIIIDPLDGETIFSSVPPTAAAPFKGSQVSTTPRMLLLELQSYNDTESNGRKPWLCVVMTLTLRGEGVAGLLTNVNKGEGVSKPF